MFWHFVYLRTKSIYESNEHGIMQMVREAKRVSSHAGNLTHQIQFIWISFESCFVDLYLVFTYVYIHSYRTVIVEKEFYAMLFAFQQFVVVFAYIILFFTIGRTDNFLCASVKCKTIYHHTTYIRRCVCLCVCMRVLSNVDRGYISSFSKQTARVWKRT